MSKKIDLDYVYTGEDIYEFREKLIAAFEKILFDTLKNVTSDNKLLPTHRKMMRVPKKVAFKLLNEVTK